MTDERRDSSELRLLHMLDTAMGPVISALRGDPEVIELQLNPDGKLWVDRLGKGLTDSGHIVRPEDSQRIIELVAASSGSVCNAAKPEVSAELPGCGSRFQGVLPPVTAQPMFTLRKKALLVYTLDDYVKQGIMTDAQRAAIVDAVRTKQNILIVGATNSGKTTLANGVLQEISKTGDRIVTIEDTLELQCTAENHTALRTADNVTMTQLLKITMRLSPKRIVVGEVRDGAALDLLKAWNTGHPGGCATIHADDALGGLVRLEQLIAEASLAPQRRVIAQAVNLVIFIEPYQNSRRIGEIVRVERQLNNEEYVIHPVA